jgi:hypothetical protein
MSERKFATGAFLGALLGLSAVAGGCDAGARPFAAAVGIEASPTSGLWGDGTAGPDGMEIGCISGRRLALVITVENRTKRTITLLGADGPGSVPGVIDRPAVQVRLAPPPPKGDIFVAGLHRWSRRNPVPVAIPPGRSAWVQSNLLMRDCAFMTGPSTVDGSWTLHYRDGGSSRNEVVFVSGAQIRLTRGPQHPSLPINQIG